MHNIAMDPHWRSPNSLDLEDHHRSTTVIPPLAQKGNSSSPQQSAAYGSLHESGGESPYNQKEKENFKKIEILKQIKTN